ncbi:MAG TPA: SprT-like domain-containing protein [Bacteroidales bacterium]|jgi:hypothetical protein|nr:SprT-like domain-containing protein [Bacteroidales bacterium]OQC60485.1 MAG: Protein SprT [Bacteroidetes bacterium ADurb.Bin012]HNQ59973.1 SprT-like domain-containing protein [Bacteroidales bacterium]HNU21567.1 SprT-like domain-containing protein [Bacteroidales bacterium]HNV17136.1 SprT-like domain-containing protein [Bacteroidales bacterium]
MTIRERSSIEKNLAPLLPEAALHQVVDLLFRFQVDLVVTYPRSGRLGDYLYNTKNNRHRISININLNRYQFLITLLHEFAHLLVQERFKTEVRPHGKEWHAAFCEISMPFLRDDIFPLDVKAAFGAHLKSRYGSAYADKKLSKILERYNGIEQNRYKVELGTLPVSSKFFLSGRSFQCISRQGNVILCQELKTGTIYRMSSSVFVKPYL